MPPKGLYSMPRHHLYGAHNPRRTFNTMDFDEDSDNADTISAPMPQQDGASDLKPESETKEGKKKKKKHSHIPHVESDARATTSVDQRSASPNIKAKRSSQKKEEKLGADHVSHSSARKRKRESEGRKETPSVTRATSVDGFVIGSDMLNSLETSMNDIGASFRNWSNSTENGFEKDPKKEVGRKSNDMMGELNAKPKTSAQTANNPNTNKQKRKSGAEGDHDVKTSKSHTLSSPYTSVPRKSHVPFPPPPQSQMSALSALQKKEQQHQEKGHDSELVIIPETPPSAATKIPPTGRATTAFPKSTFSDALRAAILPPKNQSATPILSSSRSDSDIQTPASSPAATPRPQKKSQKSSDRSFLSPATLEKMLNIQPRATKPPAKLHSRHTSGDSSIETSLPSSGSSISIPASFDRVGMPYARSGASVDPFTQPEIKKKKHREPHEEAKITVFKQKFQHAQKTVNFSDEQDYLDKHLELSAEKVSASSYPCLGKATGCTSKKEKILQEGKEEGNSVVQFQEVGGNDPDAMVDATQRVLKAEDFLMTAVRARIPVPIGPLAGTWTLFCPKYAEHHFDRYSLGQRTLTIYEVVGSMDPGTFTARLNIPPRSTSFVVGSFAAPPHASFRTTVLKIVPEGYKIEVVFLGNGYLQLRADLNLLLRGKPTEMADGKNVYMEFVGKNEKALEWVEKKNELEEEGKRLFAKYGGVDDD
ncbi:hypothetical protein K505DRAFT_375111 [Melanomma pulvis-pyrius CBS 109.77]|uniref:Uncharacterized protein n=1 Tax=Melanomma pulvis-pyrius CBS 109.77 TaxID=1314802 RepID=A0A6A6XBF2_9PLEO|nr:hypothetical protein K505DRAFT_375111 [Melanomma pulvis-pyrius CBS 109.77]